MAGIFHSSDTFSGVRRGKKSASDKALLALAVPSPQAPERIAKTREYEERVQEIARIESEIAKLKKMQKKGGQNAAKKKGKKAQSAQQALSCRSI